MNLKNFHQLLPSLRTLSWPQQQVFNSDSSRWETTINNLTTISSGTSVRHPKPQEDLWEVIGGAPWRSRQVILLRVLPATSADDLPANIGGLVALSWWFTIKPGCIVKMFTNRMVVLVADPIWSNCVANWRTTMSDSSAIKAKECHWVSMTQFLQAHIDPMELS